MIEKGEGMKDEIAILMAAGLGSRMRPLTLDCPKPLISVCGKPMIETVLDALEKRGVRDIYIVTGYLGDRFSILKEKYHNITLVRNEYYETVNNISSIHAVTDVMRGRSCFICEADLYISNAEVLLCEHEGSCYYGKFVKGFSDDWVFDQDESGRITRVGKCGTDCYNMCGISYFQKEDASLIADAIDEAWGKEGYEDLFWDEIVDSSLDRLNLRVHPIDPKDIVEIDTVDELREVEEESGKRV